MGNGEIAACPLMQCIQAAKVHALANPQSDPEGRLQRMLEQVKDQKVKSIVEKQEQVEFLEMIIINNINIIDQLDFLARKNNIEVGNTFHEASSDQSNYRYYRYGKRGVHDLIQFFDKLQ